jgi:hypothetical protein
MMAGYLIGYADSANEYTRVMWRYLIGDEQKQIYNEYIHERLEKVAMKHNRQNDTELNLNDLVEAFRKRGLRPPTLQGPVAQETAAELQKLRNEGLQ